MSEQLRRAPRQGPLVGVRVVELAGAGPGPHAGMLLADLGAEVVCVQRAGATGKVMQRGRLIVEADLKDEADRARVLELVSRADVLIEGYRPGVVERLGLGPDDCLARNPRLVYARMSGWGQTGPMADRAGHDINYVGLTGVLHAVGRKGDRPLAPINLVGDFGGGSTYLAIGILAALFERQTSGRGQVVDAAIVDGASSLAQMIWELRGAGRWEDERGTNRLDSGAPFYDVYTTADDRYMAVGCLEPRFYSCFVEGLGLHAADLPPQNDPEGWPVLRKLFRERFLTQTRDHWADVFDGTDACVTPVLSFDEVPDDPHAVARQALVEVDGVAQPAPAPRFSRTPAGVPTPPQPVDMTTLIEDWNWT